MSQLDAAAAASFSSSSSSSLLSSPTLPLVRFRANPLSDLYLLESLGNSVWRAILRPTGQLLAVKIVRGAEGEEEAALLSALPPHPNITTLHCCWREGVDTWLGLQCMDASLAELLSEVGIMDEELLAQVLVLLLRGLDFLHSQGVSHRDLKPSNILVWNGQLCL